MDDATAEQLLRGRTVDARPDLDPLAALVAETRALSDVEPAPSAALAALLRDGFTPAAPTAPLSAVPISAPRSRRRHRLAAVAGMSLGLKVLAGTGVALAGVTGAAGAGVLPGPVQDGVAGVVRTLTPFDLPTSGTRAPATEGRPERDRPEEAPRTVPALTPPAPAPAPAGPPARPVLPAPAERAPERPVPGQPRPAPTPTSDPPSGRTPAAPADRPVPGREQTSAPLEERRPSPAAASPADGPARPAPAATPPPRTGAPETASVRGTSASGSDATEQAPAGSGGPAEQAR